MTDERPITGTGAAKFSRDERPIGKRVKKRGEVDDWGSVDSAQSKALQERAKQVVVKLEPEMREWAGTPEAAKFASSFEESDALGKALDTLKVPKSVDAEVVALFVLGAGDEGKSRAELEEEWHLRFKALETVRLMCYAPGTECREALRPYVTYTVSLLDIEAAFAEA